MNLNNLEAPTFIYHSDCREMLCTPLEKRDKIKVLRAWANEWELKAKHWVEFPNQFPKPSDATLNISRERAEFCIAQQAECLNAIDKLN